MAAERLLTDEFIAERRSHIDPAHGHERVDPGPLRTRSETIYLTVADAEGNMVSFINSNYDFFGSGMVAPGTGFVLHNRGAGFTLTPRFAEHSRAGQAAVSYADSGFGRTVEGRDEPT